MSEQWVLIGRLLGTTKALGPYDSADSAKEACNVVGIPADWEVVPLIAP